MASKSTRAFRTISEASDELDLKPHVLRFWEAKFPDLKPLTRAGGRRFYRPEDIDLLRGLRILLHDERHKIKDVQKLIKVRGVQSVIELGQSAVNTQPSRPIEERDLVPERIKPAVIKPSAAAVAKPEPLRPIVVPFGQQPASTQQPAPQPSVATASAALASPQPEPPQPNSEPKGLTEAETRELEGALDRLSALRIRWKKFT